MIRVVVGQAMPKREMASRTFHTRDLLFAFALLCRVYFTLNVNLCIDSDNRLSRKQAGHSGSKHRQPQDSNTIGVLSHFTALHIHLSRSLIIA